MCLPGTTARYSPFLHTGWAAAFQNPGMKETERRGKPPGVDGGTSWADETLPLGLRRELLARELQQLAATKARPQSAGSRPGLTGRKAEGRTRERAR